MLFRRMDEEQELCLQIDVYTSPDDFSDEQKQFTKRMFLKLVFDLAVIDLCIVAVFLLGEVFFALPGIYFAIKAVIGIAKYGSIMQGAGLRSVMLLFEDRVRIIDVNGAREFPYRHITDGAFFEKGLVLRFKDGGSFCADMKSLKNSEHSAQAMKLLSKKLSRKFKNKFDTPEFKQQQADKQQRDSRRRADALGTRVAEVIYEPDGTDCRDYCRLLLNTGRAKTVVGVLIPVLAAFATALPIISLITGEYMLESVAFLPLIILCGLLFLSKIGIAAPGKKRFTAKVGSLLSIYLHADGVCAAVDGQELMYKWSELADARFYSGIGFALDTGEDGVIFVPADMLPEETMEMVEERFSRNREDR